MKKNVLRAIVPMIAILLSLTTPKTTCYYFIYNGTGPQRDMSSYSITTATQAACLGANRLCWIYLCAGDNVVSEQDFQYVFDALDSDSDGTLDDEPEKFIGSTILEKKF